MMKLEDILNGIEQCKPLIKNWEAMEGIGFDFQEIRIDGLLVDKHANERNEKWRISLLTTMYTKTQSDGRDMYSVHWHFKDLWGNLPWFVYKGPESSGALHLSYVDYDDFAVLVFKIISARHQIIFEFSEPDETAVVSVRFSGHQTLAELFPKEYPDGDELFPI